MGKYIVDTDQGQFEVETDEPENPITKGINDFGAGAMEGATFGTATIDKGGNVASAPKESPGVPGSIMQGDGNAKKDFLDRNFTPSIKNAGRAMGGLIPLIASELLAGASADALALKFGMGPVQAAMNQTGLTMATYEGVKGTVENKPTADKLGSMAAGYSAGVPLGAAGYGANKAIGWLTNDVPKELGNQYVRPSPKVADSLTDKGKPDLGESFLKDTNYNSSMSKKEVYNDVKRRLGNNREVVRGKLQQADAAIPTGTTETTEEYVPLDIRKPSKVPGPGSNLLNQDLSVQEPTKFKRGFSETPLPGGYEPSLQKEYEVYKTAPKEDTVSGGHFNEKTTNNSGTYERGILNEPTRVSKLPGGPGGGINLDEVRSSAGPVGQEQSDIGAKAAADSISNLMGEYGIAPGERVVTNERAYQLLGRLDADVNKAYQALDPNTITPATEARAKMANTLRDMLRQANPEAAELLGQNHRLQLYESSLLPQVSGRAPVSGREGWLSTIAAKTLGSRVGLGVARGLEAVGTPGKEIEIPGVGISVEPNWWYKKTIKPSVDRAAKQGLAEYLDRGKHRGNR